MGVFVFLKAQSSSLIATAVDFAVTILLREFLGVWYLAASITGVISGGICNFLINRSWVFRRPEGKANGQAVRYILIWTGSLWLNSAGVWLLREQAGIGYLPAKVLVSLIVGWGFNYTLQKRYVFR